MDRKVALITAGGSGMGAGVARGLASDGFKVAVMSSSGKGESLGRELDGIGYTGSILRSEDQQGFVDQVLSQWGRVDVLVNGAGHGPKGDLLAIEDEAWTDGMQMYFLSAVRMIRLVTPLMQRAKSGRIVNISTYATFEPEAAFPTSAAFRASLAAFSKIYADRYAADGISINNVLPGFIDSLPEKEAFRRRIPMGRYGKVDEVAALVSYLVSDRAGYMTGQNLRIDGAITRSV